MIVSGVVPAVNRGGGCLALHRHFVENNDFKVCATGCDLSYCTVSEVLDIHLYRIVSRLKRGLLKRPIQNLQYLINLTRIPPELVLFANRWKPDIIFTVPDNLHIAWAHKLARLINVPLAVNFQDIFPISNFLATNDRPYGFIRKSLLDKFREVNSFADLVLYTSEGMRDWFGGSRNGKILYPMGANEPVRTVSAIGSKEKITLVYAGNCYGAYGRLLLRFANLVSEGCNIDLRIFAAGNDWSNRDSERLSKLGILRGFLPFSELKEQLALADGFLTVMSFEPGEQIFVSTSFTTKWLDYAPYSKPVFVWAPSYSSAFKFSMANDCGVVVGTDSERSLANAVLSTMRDESKYMSACRRSERIANGPLSSTSIHRTLVNSINELLEKPIR